MARVSRKKKKVEQAETTETSFRVWKTAIYVRLSVEDNGRDSDSIETQQALLEEYISSHPYLQKVALFVDNGYTGTNFLRPDFSRMMEAVKVGLVDCIIVKDLSRLGRSYIETSEFIEKICPFYGLRFIAVSNQFDTENGDSSSQLSASLTNIINDCYAKDISRKVSSALQSKMERGDYIGNYAPHGYKKDPDDKNHLIVNPDTAPIIRQIFQWRAEGISYMGINRRLNDAGVPSPSQYKADHGIHTNNNQKGRTILWNKHMVTEILSNNVYIGHLSQRKIAQCLHRGVPSHHAATSEQITVYNTHEAIVSEDLFERVQSINRAASEKAKANSGKYDHLPKEKNIYGKKFTCGGCGSVMKLIRSFSTKRDKAYFMFKCPVYAEHGSTGCSDVKIRKADLDEAVFHSIKTQMEVFLDMDKTLHRLLQVKKAKSGSQTIEKEVQTLKQSLAHKQSLLSSMYVDLKDGLLSQEDFGQHRSIVSEDITIIQHQLEELESILKRAEEPVEADLRWRTLVKKYGNATEISEELVTAFVESIILNTDSSLSIKLKYMDEFAELTKDCEHLRKEVA